MIDFDQQCFTVYWLGLMSAAGILANQSSFLGTIQWPDEANAVDSDGVVTLYDLPSSITREQMLKILENFTILLSTIIPRGPAGPTGPKGDPGRCDCEDYFLQQAEEWYEDRGGVHAKKTASSGSKRFGPKSKTRIKPGKRHIHHKSKKSKNHTHRYPSAEEPESFEQTSEIAAEKLKKTMKKVSSKSS